MLCCLSFKRIKFKNKSTEHPLLWLISLTTAAIRNDIFPNIKNLATFPTIKIKHNVQHRRHECGKTSPINNKSYDHYPIARYPSDIPKRGASPWTSHHNPSVTLPNLNEVPIKQTLTPCAWAANCCYIPWRAFLGPVRLLTGTRVLYYVC